MQERKDDATNATLQKIRRRYGVAYMQHFFFALPGGVLLQQYYTGRSSIGYDCFILAKPAALRIGAATKTALLLYPLENSLALRYQNKKYVCTPQHCCYIAGETLSSLRWLLPAGEARCLYICLPDATAYNAVNQRRPVILKSNQKILRLTESLLHCSLQGQALELFISARADDLLRYYLSSQRQQRHNVRAQRLEQVQAYIQEHLQEPLSDKVLAGIYGTGVTVFRENFKAHFGETPHRHILRLRMEQAKYLLLHTTSTVEEIAWEIGYQFSAAFYKAFSRHFGYTPTVLRNNKLN